MDLLRGIVYCFNYFSLIFSYFIFLPESFLRYIPVQLVLFFRDENYSDQVLEKQADMIRYLKQHNSQLGKRILAITAENNAMKSQISRS